MLNQSEIPAFIAGQLPQIGGDLTGRRTSLTVYQSIQVLTD